MDATNQNLRVEAAYGAIVADGCFALAFTLHLLSLPAGGVTMADFIGVGIIFSVFFSASGIIYETYWQRAGRAAADVVKKLQIKELRQGARIEFDGKTYQVDSINRSKGEILIQRVGQPGSIIVQIESQR